MRPRHIDSKLVLKAKQVVAQTTDIKELKAAQAVLLPALADTTLEETARLLGVGRASVHRWQQQFRQSVRAPSVPRKKIGRASCRERGELVGVDECVEGKGQRRTVGKNKHEREL